MAQSQHGNQIHPTLKALAVPIDQLRHLSGNARKGNIEAITESLEINGQYRPIVVRRSTNEVLAGNHTLRAARDLGWDEIAVTWVDCTDKEATKIALADNKTNDDATYDNEALKALLLSLGDSFEGTGFDEIDAAKIIEGITPNDSAGKGLGNMVVQYNIVFDDDRQQQLFYAFIQHLKKLYPKAESLGERLSLHIREVCGSEAAAS